MVLQFCLIVIGLCGALSALALIPRRWTFLAPMGAYTIVVYLLHGFVIRWLAGWGWAEKVPLTGVARNCSSPSPSRSVSACCSAGRRWPGGSTTWSIRWARPRRPSGPSPQVELGLPAC